jgi:hypothetical protein
MGDIDDDLGEGYELYVSKNWHLRNAARDGVCDSLPTNLQEVRQYQCFDSNIA